MTEMRLEPGGTAGERNNPFRYSPPILLQLVVPHDFLVPSHKFPPPPHPPTPAPARNHYILVRVRSRGIDSSRAAANGVPGGFPLFWVQGRSRTRAQCWHNVGAGYKARTEEFRRGSLRDHPPRDRPVISLTDELDARYFAKVVTAAIVTVITHYCSLDRELPSNKQLYWHLPTYGQLARAFARAKIPSISPRILEGSDSAGGLLQLRWTRTALSY